MYVLKKLLPYSNPERPGRCEKKLSLVYFFSTLHFTPPRVAI